MRKPKPLPSVDELNKWFRYDPETGDLWKKPKVNAKGELRVLTSLKPIRRKTYSKTTEYYQVYIPCSDRFYLVHRIIWKMWYGDDQFGCECKVMKFVKGLSLEQRNKLHPSHPDKQTYRFCDEGFNNLKPYAWDEFGPGKYFGQDVDYWQLLPGSPE